MMKQVLALLKKDLAVDWRTKYPVAGLLLYLTTLVVTSFFAYAGVISDELWNALLWTLLLFTSVNAIAKGFVQEDNRMLYYFFTVSPTVLIAAKLIYHLLYQLLLSVLTLILFSLFFGSKSLDFLFWVVLFFGSLGLSSAFTFISALASKTNSPSVMMAILGFPVVIPILLLAIQCSKVIVLGGSWMDIQTNFLTLVSVNVIIIALTFILFPFTWKS